MDDITHEPLPRRWVELIHYLDEQELKRGEHSQAKNELGDQCLRAEQYWFLPTAVLAG